MTAEYYPNDLLKYLHRHCTAKLFRLEVSKLWYPYVVRILMDFSYVPAINLWGVMDFIFFLSYVHIIQSCSFHLFSNLLNLLFIPSTCTIAEPPAVKISSFISPHVPLIPSDHSSYSSRGNFIIVQTLLYSFPSLNPPSDSWLFLK